MRRNCGGVRRFEFFMGPHQPCGRSSSHSRSAAGPATSTPRKMRVIYSFGGGNNAGYPDGGLTQDSPGNFYGTTVHGGAHGYGTVFEVNRDGTENVIYSFTGGLTESGPQTPLSATGQAICSAPRPTVGMGRTAAPSASAAASFSNSRPTAAKPCSIRSRAKPGGAVPSGLIEDTAGNLYGTAEVGGDLQLCNGPGGSGCGVVSEVAPNGTETVLQKFRNVLQKAQCMKYQISSQKLCRYYRHVPKASGAACARRADDPVRLDPGFDQRLIDADLIGAKRAPALEHQHDLSEIASVEFRRGNACCHAHAVLGFNAQSSRHRRARRRP